MKNNQIKKVVYLVIILLAIYLIFFIIKTKNNKKVEESNRLNDSEIYFTIQSTVNDYIVGLNKYNNPNFVANSIYYKEKDLNTFYFVNGFVLDYILDDQINYYNNINYLVAVKGRTYNIIDITCSSIQVCSNNYDISAVDVKKGNLLSNNSYSEESKLVSYIENYLVLLSEDKIASYVISNNKDYYDIDSSIKSYTKKTDNNKTIYNVIDEKNNNITITENYVMDYKIEVN